MVIVHSSEQGNWDRISLTSPDEKPGERTKMGIIDLMGTDCFTALTTVHMGRSKSVLQHHGSGFRRVFESELAIVDDSSTMVHKQVTTSHKGFRGGDRTCKAFPLWSQRRLLTTHVCRHNSVVSVNRKQD